MILRLMARLTRFQMKQLLMAVGDSVVDILAWLVLGLAVFSVAALTITRRKRPNSVVFVGNYGIGHWGGSFFLPLSTGWHALDCPHFIWRCAACYWMHRIVNTVPSPARLSRLITVGNWSSLILG